MEIKFKGDTKTLESFILKLRGRSFSYVKKLNVAITMMECYLATKTGNPWPGNLDAAVWDENKNNFVAIIEFKTHNYPQYPISRQYFGQPKIIYVIWGTHESHKEVKLQIINNLKASNDKYIKRPEFTDSTFKDFTKETDVEVLE
jgi:hypothetical protein